MSSCSEDERLFQALGPAHENERSPNFRRMRGCCKSLIPHFLQNRAITTHLKCYSASALMSQLATGRRSRFVVDTLVIRSEIFDAIRRCAGIVQAITSSAHSSRSASPSSSPATDTPTKEKVGVPIFRDENGQRRLHLIIDIGTTFRPHDITVQVVSSRLRIYSLMFPLDRCFKRVLCVDNSRQCNYRQVSFEQLLRQQIWKRWTTMY